MARPFDQAGIQAGDVSAMAMMNMAVNGFADVSQENGDASVALVNNGVKYIADQISTFMIGALGITGQRVPSPFPSLPGITYGTKFTAPSAVVPGAGDTAVMYQPIEASRIKKLGWGTALGIPMTVGFIVRPSFNLTTAVTLDNGVATSRKILKRIYAPANQDTFIPLRFDPETTGVWAKDNTNGLSLSLTLVAGANKLGAYDQWGTSTVPAAGADITNLCTVAGQSVIVSGLVMFPGIVPLSKEVLPLIARNVPDELALAQRYFSKTYADGVLPGTLTGANALCHIMDGQQNYGAVNWDFPQTMRIAPSIITWNPNYTNVAGSFRNTNASSDLGALVQTTGDKRVCIYVNNLSSGISQTLIIHASSNARM